MAGRSTLLGGMIDGLPGSECFVIERHARDLMLLNAAKFSHELVKQ